MIAFFVIKRYGVCGIEAAWLARWCAKPANAQLAKKLYRKDGAYMRS